MKRSLRITSLALVSAAILPTSLYPEKRCTPEGMICAGLVTAGIGAGLYGLFSWLSTPSDAQLLDNADRLLRDIHRDHDDLMSSCDSLFSSNSSIARAPEASLYKIAETYFRAANSNDPANKLYAVNQHRNNLKDQINAIQKRMNKVAKDFGYNSQIYHALDSIALTLSSMKTKLDFVHSILSTHNGYFNLYYCEDSLWKSYRRELDAMRSYEFSRDRLQQELRSCVMMSGNTSEHPGRLYILYINALNSNISLLEKKMRNCSYAYHERLQWCRNMTDWLNKIKSTVVSDPDYSYAIASYERLKAEQEAAAAQRERAAAERERARVERDRTRVEREKTAALEEQNRILRRQNRLHEEEWYDSRDRRTDVRVYFDVAEKY
jgi:hypothetical protein